MHDRKRLDQIAALIVEQRIEEIARVAHEVNRAYCQALGDFSQTPWDEAPEWQRQSTIEGVKLHLDNRSADPSASHVAWMERKKSEGWIYGTVKDEEAKTHPCMVPFASLPQHQQAKDFIFRQIVHSVFPDVCLFAAN